MGILYFYIEFAAFEKINPAYQIPKDKLIDVEKLLEKPRSLSSCLDLSSNKTCHRKDLNNRWD